MKPMIPEECWPPVLLLRVAADDDPLALRQWLPLLGVTPGVTQRLRDRALGQQAPFARTCYAARIREINRFHTAVVALREQASTAQRLIRALSTITGSRVPDDLQQHLEAATLENGELPRLPQLIHRLYESYGVLDPEDSIPDQDRVLVATMHSAKGLEAEYVYCPWLNSVFMPMAGRDVEEQRRVLYVALTRAKKDVLITFPEAFDASRGYRLRQEAMSPFLAEIAVHLRILRTTADNVRATPIPWFIPEANAA
jgi:superfamily I DNA/RNA helicase